VLASPLGLAGPGVEPPETEIAAGDQRAHPQGLGLGERLAERRLRSRAFRVAAFRTDRAEEMVGAGAVAAFSPLLGEVQRAPSLLEGRIGPAGMNEFPSAAPGNSCFLCARAIDPEASRLLRNGEAIHLACARALMAEAFGEVVPPAVWFSWPPAPTGADTPETLPTDPPSAGPSSPSQPDRRNHAVRPPAPPAPPPDAPIS
jgi:hypothetical protein